MQIVKKMCKNKIVSTNMALHFYFSEKNPKNRVKLSARLV